MDHNPAPVHPTAANSAAAVSFDDPGDFDRASRGLVAQLDLPVVTMKNGRVIFDAAIHDLCANQTGRPIQFTQASGAKLASTASTASSRCLPRIRGSR